MREKFSSELKVAMKAGEKRRVGTIRMIMAALKESNYLLAQKWFSEFEARRRHHARLCDRV